MVGFEMYVGNGFGISRVFEWELGFNCFVL